MGRSGESTLRVGWSRNHERIQGNQAWRQSLYRLSPRAPLLVGNTSEPPIRRPVGPVRGAVRTRCWEPPNLAGCPPSRVGKRSSGHAELWRSPILRGIRIGSIRGRTVRVRVRMSSLRVGIGNTRPFRAVRSTLGDVREPAGPSRGVERIPRTLERNPFVSERSSFEPETKAVRVSKLLREDRNYP